MRRKRDIYKKYFVWAVVRNNQSHKALQLSNDFAMSVLQFCVCQARAIWQRGRLEQLFLKALFKCAPTNARKNQCVKKTSRLFKGDS